MQLKGKAVIVTGSTTGIGEAIARACAAEGAAVMVHGRSRDRAETVARELGKLARVHVDDLEDPAAPGRLVEAAISAFGRIDGVVNNAALIIRSNLESTNAPHFDRVMAVNARAPLLLIKSAMPHLVDAAGAVVNIGSINAYTGEPRQLDYSMSKAALMTLSRNLANVYSAAHVRINHFNVGWVLTPNEYRLKVSEGLPEGWSSNPDPAYVPTGKMTEPADIARQAVFWLSDDSRPITGSVIDLEQYPVIGRLALKEGDA